MLTILLKIASSILTYVLPLAFTIKSFESTPPVSDTTFKYLLNYWMYFIVLQFLNYTIISQSLRSSFDLISDGLKIWLFYGPGNIEKVNSMVLQRVGNLRQLEYDFIEPILKRYTPRRIRGISTLHQHLLQLGLGDENIINVGLLNTVTTFIATVLKTLFTIANTKPQRGRKRSGTGKSRSSTTSRNVLGSSNSNQIFAVTPASASTQISPKSYAPLASQSQPISRSISPALQSHSRVPSGTFSTASNMLLPRSRRSSGTVQDGIPPYLNPQNNKAQLLEASIEALTPSSRKISADLMNSDSFALYEGYFKNSQPLPNGPQDSAPAYATLDSDPKPIPAVQDIHLAAHPASKDPYGIQQELLHNTKHRVYSRPT
jgi:hypothetical protein